MPCSNILGIPYPANNRATAARRYLCFCSVRNVRFGSQADICAATRHVRFTPNSDQKSGHAAKRYVCFTPESGLMQCNSHVCFGPIADIWLFNDRTGAYRAAAVLSFCAAWNR
jgi:hypothetical protein